MGRGEQPRVDGLCAQRVWAGSDRVPCLVSIQSGKWLTGRLRHTVEGTVVRPPHGPGRAQCQGGEVRGSPQQAETADTPASEAETALGW